MRFLERVVLRLRAFEETISSSGSSETGLGLIETCLILFHNSLSMLKYSVADVDMVANMPAF